VRLLRRHLRQVPARDDLKMHPLRQEGPPGRRLRVQGAELPKQAQKTYAKAVYG
jgi:hypothetical protein